MADHEVELVEIRDDWPQWRKDDAIFANEARVRNHKLTEELRKAGAQVIADRTRKDTGPSAFALSQAEKRKATEEAELQAAQQEAARLLQIEHVQTLKDAAGEDTSERRKTLDEAIEGVPQGRDQLDDIL